jgi:hypothetical protein
MASGASQGDSIFNKKAQSQPRSVYSSNQMQNISYYRAIREAKSAVRSIVSSRRPDRPDDENSDKKEVLQYASSLRPPEKYYLYDNSHNSHHKSSNESHKKDLENKIKPKNTLTNPYTTTPGIGNTF